GNAWVGVRPEDVEISRERRDSSLGGIITERTIPALRSTTLLAIRVGEHEVHAHVAGAGDETGQAGDSVWLTFKRYHVFDRESGVARGVEQRLDLRSRESRAHVRVFGEGLAERARLRDGRLRRVVDRVVRPLPADLLAELEHQRLGHDETAGQVEVLAHPLRK